jgi:hypothetical protein
MMTPFAQFITEDTYTSWVFKLDMSFENRFYTYLERNLWGFRGISRAFTSTGPVARKNEGIESFRDKHSTGNYDSIQLYLSKNLTFSFGVLPNGLIVCYDLVGDGAWISPTKMTLRQLVADLQEFGFGKPKMTREKADPNPFKIGNLVRFREGNKSHIIYKVTKLEGDIVYGYDVTKSPDVKYFPDVLMAHHSRLIKS